MPNNCQTIHSDWTNVPRKLPLIPPVFQVSGKSGRYLNSRRAAIVRSQCPENAHRRYTSVGKNFDKRRPRASTRQTSTKSGIFWNLLPISLEMRDMSLHGVMMGHASSVMMGHASSVMMGHASSVMMGHASSIMMGHASRIMMGHDSRILYNEGHASSIMMGHASSIML